MVIWTPLESSKLHRLHEICRRMGAPHFLSSDEMAAWIRIHFDSVKGFLLNSLNPVIEILKGFESNVFGNLLKALLEIQRRRTRASLQEQLTLNNIKALNTPLLLIPKTLHPNRLAA